MKFLKQTAGAAALGATVLFGGGLSASPAQAGYIETLAEQNGNVVASGSGTLNLAGLSLIISGDTSQPGMNPAFGSINVGMNTGPFNAPPVDLYTGITGPTSFGGGLFIQASSGSGGPVVIQGANHDLAVPQGYVSGALLGTSTATWNNATFTSLGVTQGTYTWTWASDSFTLIIGTPASVPEPSALALLGTALAGLCFVGFQARRRERADGGAALPIR